MNNLDVAKFIENYTGRYSRQYAEAVNDLFVAIVSEDRVAMAAARKKLGEIMAATMGVGEVIGATSTLRRTAGVYARMGMALRADRGYMWAFSAGEQDLLPSVTFTEAVDDMVARTPVTIRRAAERTAQKIAELYSTDHAVAFVRSAEESVTEAAQKFIARAIKEGIPSGEAGKQLAMTANDIRVESEAWSEAYAQMAYRTNMVTAVTAGRFRQAQDPDIKAVIPAFRFTIRGYNTRPNHSAADGLIMAVDDTDWQRIAPPLGYNCFCDVHEVPLPELEDAGLIDAGGNVRKQRIPPGAHPDPGFRHGGRPDLFMAGR